MLSVSITAKKKLREILQSKTEDPEVAIRIIPSASEPTQLGLGLDKQKEGDHVVEDDEGKKVLLVGSNLVPVLEGKVFDYKETPQGSGFTIYKLSSDN
jgi:Fe-S cluster assembly iron-binding protein IscA